MASEPVLSREVGNLMSRVSQPVIVISAIVNYVLEALKRETESGVYDGGVKKKEVN
jgi:hypothetical protein